MGGRVHPLLPTVHWDGIDSGMQAWWVVEFGMFPLCPGTLGYMMGCDGMDHTGPAEPVRLVWLWPDQFLAQSFKVDA